MTPVKAIRVGVGLYKKNSKVCVIKIQSQGVVMALLAKLAFVTAGAWVWIQSSAIYIKHLFSLKCLEKTKTKKKRPGKVNK